MLILILTACQPKPAGPLLDSLTWGQAEAEGLQVLADPSELGLSPEALEHLIWRAWESRSEALLVAVGETPVLRWPEDSPPIETMSVTKSIASLGIGMLIDDGAIPGLETPVAHWFPEWTDERGAITLEHLLTHSSGLAAPDTAEIYASSDFVRLALDAPVVAPPGERWVYNNSASNLVTAIGSAAAGQPFDEYLDERLWGPMGLGPREWSRDEAGNTHGLAGLKLSAEDLYAVGLLMLREGRWGEQQLISPEWIRRCTEPSARSEVYGLQWWLLPDGLGFRADGWLGQYLVVLPEYELIAVRQRRSNPGHWRYGSDGLDTLRDFQELVAALPAP